MPAIVTAVNCPAPITPSTPPPSPTAKRTSGASLPTSDNFTTGQTTVVSGRLNRNAAAQDVQTRYASGGFSVGYGLGLSAGAGLTVNVAAGQAMIDGVVEKTGVTVVVVPANSARAWIWLKQDGTFTVVDGSLTPPAGDCVLVGSCVTNATVVTAVDTSGVVYSKATLLWRETADAGVPGDTPPASWLGYTKTAGGTYFWTGSAYALLGTSGVLLTDGDKGEITVASGGTVWTIDNGVVGTAKLADDAVTYAKIQDVSATDRLLGRATAGAGIVEEIPLTAFGRSLIDDATAADARATLDVDQAGTNDPSGSTNYVQVANAGAFGSDQKFQYDLTNKVLTVVSGSVVAAGTATILLTGEGNRERVEIRSFNDTVGSIGPFFLGIGAGGTVANPTATPSGAFLAFLGGGGYNNTPDRVANMGWFALKSAEAWTTTAQGVNAEIHLTTPATTTRAQKFAVTGYGSVICGGLSALSTTATDGDLYIPTCAGTPTGVPTAYTGKVALRFDTTNNKLWVYDGGWIGVPLS